MSNAIPEKPGQPDAQPPYTEDDIHRLVHRFYGKVRQDEQLGPIFNARIVDWDEHLAKLCDFWSSLLLGTRRFKGAPVPAHARIPYLSWPLFQRWLSLFHGTSAELNNPALQARVDAMSERIATNLWGVWQSRSPASRLSDTLPTGVVPYSESPIFTPETLPEGLKAAHSIKAGAWGLLKVHSGVLRYTLDDDPGAEVILVAGQQVVIDPQVKHHVAFEMPGSFQITFCRTNEPRIRE